MLNSLAIVEIVIAIIFLLPVIYGFILIIKDKQLSIPEKILWIISLFVFNFIALFAYFLLRKKDK
jgi:uncharacterized membrane protein YsdA (DUF1294 family)